MPHYVVIIFQSIKQDGAGSFGQVGYDIAAELHNRGESVLLFTINKGPFTTKFPAKAVLLFPRTVLWFINKLLKFKLLTSVSAYKVQEFLFDYCLSKRDLSGDVLITTFPLLPLTLKKCRKNFKKIILIPQNPSELYIRELYKEEFRIYGIPVLPGDAYEDAWRIRKQQETLPYIDEIVSISSITNKSYADFNGSKRIIPYYVRKNLSHEDGMAIKKEGKFIFLFLAYIVLLKGLHHLMDAWKIWGHDESVELWIAGDIDQNLKDYLNKAFPAENIKWLGFRSDIKSLIQQSSVVVIPSLVDNEPQTTVEALSLGVPVIMSDGCGNSDWVKVVMPEAVYPMGDIAALAGKLKYFYKGYAEIKEKTQPLCDIVLKNENQMKNFTTSLLNG